MVNGSLLSVLALSEWLPVSPLDAGADDVACVGVGGIAATVPAASASNDIDVSEMPVVILNDGVAGGDDADTAGDVLVDELLPAEAVAAPAAVINGDVVVDDGVDETPSELVVPATACVLAFIGDGVGWVCSSSLGLSNSIDRCVGKPTRGADDDDAIGVRDGDNGMHVSLVDARMRSNVVDDDGAMLDDVADDAVIDDGGNANNEWRQ